MRALLRTQGIAPMARALLHAELHALNERNTDLIRRRARHVKESHPDLIELIDEYVTRQERETQLLGTDLVCAVWVLRRM